MIKDNDNNVTPDNDDQRNDDNPPDNDTLLVSSIFCSIQGESTSQGAITSFIRLCGCNLNCNYCDTRWSHEGGEEISIQKIIETVTEHKSKYVTVTGGEPLLQQNTQKLLTALTKLNYKTSIETNGTADIKGINKNTRIVMDIKCPDSLMSEHNDLQNINYLKDTDELKFVLSSTSDYNWAKSMIEKFDLAEKCTVLMSPVWEKLSPKKLAELILKDKLNVRLNLQLHKIIWENDGKEH